MISVNCSRLLCVSQGRPAFGCCFLPLSLWPTPLLLLLLPHLSLPLTGAVLTIVTAQSCAHPLHSLTLSALLGSRRGAPLSLSSCSVSLCYSLSLSVSLSLSLFRALSLPALPLSTTRST
jgi:hypothetical protein